jgi:adenylate cyclase
VAGSGTKSLEIERKFVLDGKPEWLDDHDSARIEALWPLTEGRRVAKRRYEVPHEGLTIEIDVFEGPLSGIVTAEVEFDSEQASAAFEPPVWLGEEVTGDPKYANESLATRGAPGGDAR